VSRVHELATPRVQPLRVVLRFVLDWLPLIVVLYVYDMIHNRIGRFLPAAHTLPQIHADQLLFGTPIPTVRMQRAWYLPGRVRGWDLAALAIYTSHFFASIAIALVLWLRARERYLRFMAWFVALTSIGYITYVLYPAVPPWLASQRGALEPTHRMVRELWDQLGHHGLAACFSGSSIYANDVAAIPSLHAAYPVMFLLFFWGTAGRAMRVALMLYAVAMAVTLVYTAEHYVVDIVLGWAYAAVTAFVLPRVSSRLGP